MVMVGQTVSLLVLTLFSYWAGLRLHRRLSHVLASPVFTGSILVMVVLWLTHTDYGVYRTANEPLGWLLGPAQVAMAVPLYRGWALLRRHLPAVMMGVVCGTATGVTVAVAAGKLLRLTPETILSLAPKSATTPIAMVTSGSMGGVPELAAVFAVLTGVLGMAAGPALLRWMGVHSRVLKGLALGTAAQMVGVASASKWGEPAAAMGVVGMALTALLIGLITPVLLPVLF